jgi:DNA-binding transcriptional LysR family regulator
MSRQMDRLDAMRLFVRLVECGSFTALGREEGIGQPAVSKRIAALERQLGAQLVMRTSRQVVVTEAGKALYEPIKRLLDDAEALESDAAVRQLTPRGIVRLNTAPAHGRLCITPLLPEFFRRYPDVTIEMSVSERPVDLIGAGIDLAIRHGKLLDSTLTTRLLASTDFVLAASTDYLARRGEPAALDDLVAHECIVFARGQERRPWAFKRGGESLSYVPRGSLLTGDAEHVRAAVLCGLGIIQAPRWLLEKEIESGQVRVLLPALQPDPVPISLVYQAGRRAPMRVRVCIDYLVEAFGAATPA